MIDYLVADERAYAGTLGFDEERARRRAGGVVDRTRDMAASVTNHSILDDYDTVPFRLRDINVPTLVLRGTVDPLFPYAYGEALAAGSICDQSDVSQRFEKRS